MSSTYCHEIVSFSFKPETSLAGAHQHIETIKRFSRLQTGFVSREIFFAESTGRWIDHVIWADEAAAHTAMEASFRAPELASVFQALDESSMTVGHYTQVG